MTVYTPEQVAERWACDPKTVRNMLNNGDLSGFRVGKKLWRIRAENLEEYELCQTGPSADSGENSQSSGTKPERTDEAFAGVIHLEQTTGKRRPAAPRLDTRNSPARKGQQ